jgi:tape measure domain-containing protein
MADIARTIGILFKAEGATAAAVVDKVSASLSGMDATAKAASGGFDKLGTAQGLSAEEMRKLQVQTATMQIATAKLTGDTELLARGQELLSKRFEFTSSAEEKLLLQTGKLRAETELTAARAQQLADGINKNGDAADGASAKTDRFVQALKALATAAVVKEFLDANSAVEKLNLGFTSVTGSSTAAAAEMAYVRDAADRLGIKVEDAGKAYLGLSAATKGTALEGEGARTIFEAVAKQLALLGGSSSDVAGALVQVQQGISKGKFELEDLKSIAERMPGFFDKFAEALGKTTPELFAMIAAGKVGGAELLKFAQQLNAGIASIDVDTFEAKRARFSNAWNGFLVSVGNAGAFDAAKAGLDGTGYAVEKAGAAVTAFAGTLKAVYEAARNGDTSGLWDKISAAINKAGAAGIDFEAKLLGVDLKTAKVNESLAETARLARYAADAMAGNKEISLAVDSARSIEKFGADIAKVGEAYKTLGIDTKKVNADLISAFETVAGSATATGKEILAGFGSALKSADSIEAINRLGGALTQAYVNGRVNADEFSKAAVALGAAQQKLLDPTNKSTEAVKKQADEVKRAEENAGKMVLELEKLASNERIKFMEFRAEIDVARIQADAEKVQAAFASINTGIESTGDTLKSLFGMFDKLGSLDSTAYRAVFDQIDKENRMREQSFDLQRRLNEAQIEAMRAQTQRFQQGDALIKIDGAGLQPHLEGFMWEILRTVQTRVNQEGLALLLGV